ncbi:MAG: dihydrodipicolinate reductase C-terminal domain-containing protein, partial [Flavobacteriales bacterium]|nr:dihydrodipicolinate reductase C-terminal domain-containing protein [Flavobacteriales bacterium]
MNPNLPRPSDLPPLLVVGAGKLGTAVAEAWELQGGTVASLISAGQEWQPEGLVFEATAPEAALDNLLRCADARVPVVTGTTGWFDRLGELEGRLQAAKSTAFYSTNFSPGVHALNLIAEHAAGIMSQLEGYTAHVREVHHIHKKDAPSGTALTLKHHVQQGGWTPPLDIESVR